MRANAVSLIVAITAVAACGSGSGGGSGGGGAQAGDAAAAADDAVVANATVEHIVDGDTIDVVVDGRDERVRLIGIDTPEVEHPDSPGECLGDEATRFTESLLPAGTRVRLERDIVGRDDYGRVLAYVYRASDGIFVNFEIIRHGFAQPLTIPPNDVHSSRFVEAARAAESDDVGLWSACSG